MPCRLCLTRDDRDPLPYEKIHQSTFSHIGITYYIYKTGAMLYIHALFVLFFTSGFQDLVWSKRRASLKALSLRCNNL